MGTHKSDINQSLSSIRTFLCIVFLYILYILYIWLYILTISPGQSESIEGSIDD